MKTIKPMKKENIVLCTLVQHTGTLGQVRGTRKQGGQDIGKYQNALSGPLIPPYLFLSSIVIEKFSVLTISCNSRKIDSCWYSDPGLPPEWF